MREKHKESIHLFCKANSVEKAFLKQLTQALPEIYLLLYKYTTKNTITTSLSIFLSQLIQTYGNILDEELEDEKTNLKLRIFDITQWFVHLFQAVEDLQELATATNPA